MIRATTGGVLKSYRSNLMSSFIKLNSSVNTVLTKRLFNSYAEDPSAAAQAFQVRRSYMRTSAQKTVNSAMTAKFTQAGQSLKSVVDVVDNGKSDSSWNAILVSMNDPTGDARTALGKVMNQMADDIIQNMNGTYGETFIFAGADGLNVPFEQRADGLYYRGVNVDTVVPELVESAGKPITVRDDGTGNYVWDTTQTNYLNAGKVTFMKKDDYDAAADKPGVLMHDDGTGALAPVEVDADGKPTAGGGYYMVVQSDSVVTKENYDQTVSDKEKLDYMMNEEKAFVDIGLGYKENEKDQLIESSGFNCALQGITFLGCGVDEDGDPKNLVSLLRQMADICTNFSGGKWEDSEDQQELFRLAKKFENGADDLRTMHADEWATATKLNSNYERLEDSMYTMQEQLGQLEDIDPAEAISDYLWAQYCYNAALKVGNSILSPSLMDFLNT